MSTQAQPAEDTMSIATALTPTSPSPNETRTTLTGRPIKYEHDTLSNTLIDGSIGGGATVGANLLPPGYTDSSLVHIPIRVSDYIATSDEPTYDLGNDVKREPARKESVWSRVSKRMGGCGKKAGSEGDGLRVVEMSRGEYLKYWAKGEDGQFREGVVEPPGGRAEWLEEKLERQDAKKAGRGRKKSRGTEGKASAVSAVGGAIGSVS